MKTFAQVEAENGGKFPGFAVLRHLLAAAVLVHHGRGLISGALAVPEGDGGGQIGLLDRLAALPHILTTFDALKPGVFAEVAAFFALSGFLVTASAMRTGDVRNFLTLRALRIVPALTTVVVLSAVLLGAAVTTLPLTSYFLNADFWLYFRNMVGLVVYALPGVFPHNPVPDNVNANLWTLFPEICCYLALAAMIATGALRDRRILGWAVVASALAIFALTEPGAQWVSTRVWDKHFEGWFIAWIFMGGGAFYRFADRIPFSAPAAAASFAVYYFGMLLRIPDVVSAPFLIYATIAFGALHFPRLRHFDTHDYSYGIYLYGYPISQTLVFVLIGLGLLPNSPLGSIPVIAAALALTAAFSAFSWRTIEKPALAWKRAIPSAARDASGGIREAIITPSAAR